MLSNRDELRAVLAERARLGQVFARHAYGMRCWVDLFAARIPALSAGEAELVATVVADNARHMNLFRARAAAHGVDPDAYRPPAEGAAIYDRLDELQTFEQQAAYALGSLDHFAELLAVYAGAAEGEDAAVIAAVRADNDRTRERLRGLVAPGPHADEAHELYRLRELVETSGYARAA
jgi:hypothetical protein